MMSWDVSSCRQAIPFKGYEHWCYTSTSTAAVAVIHDTSCCSPLDCQCTCIWL